MLSFGEVQLCCKVSVEIPDLGAQVIEELTINCQAGCGQGG